MSFVSRSAELQGKFRLRRDPDAAFPLFSPRGEEAWVPGWKPELLWPEGVEWEEGLVFRTNHDGDESIWFVARLDRARRRVTYHRVDLGLVAATVSVACDSDGADGTEVSVRYLFVGITERGNEFVRERTAEEYAEKMKRWERAIEGK